MVKYLAVSVDRLLISPLRREDAEKAATAPETLGFDVRRDFYIDEDFCGIAVAVEIRNCSFDSDDRDDRHYSMSVTLVDHTNRRIVATRYVDLIITPDQPSGQAYVVFAATDVEFLAETTYRVCVRDEIEGLKADEVTLHSFGMEENGHPTEWYEADSGCVVREGYREIMRTLNAGNDLLKLRFYVSCRMDDGMPWVLPEMEVRIHFPDGSVKVQFDEPDCINFSSSLYKVEAFFGDKDTHGKACYAELLCMDFPIAGFAFSLGGPETSGAWSGHYLRPLDEYTQEAAQARLDDAGLIAVKDDTWDAELEEALNRFITVDSDSDSASDEKPDSGNAAAPESDGGTDQGGNDGAPVAEAEKEGGSSLVSLDSLVGLRAVKEKLAVYESVVRFNRMRADSGLPVSPMPLHAMFLGSPGTGKTTVAKAIGMMLRRAGVLSKGHVVVRERATLLGRYYNTESENTLAAIEEARGGILLIDEAYQLCQADDPRDPGRFVIETLLTVLADETRRDWMLILAGYPDEMKRMFDMNPGFRSRIPDSNIYTFDDFSEPELMEIALRYLERQHYTLTPEAESRLSGRLGHDYAARERNFGNARHVINMIQTEILPAMAVRVTAAGITGASALTEIHAADIPQPVALRTDPRPRIGFA